MAEEKKSIEISYKANLADLKAKLKTIPNITDQEAKKMVSALDRQLKQAEKAAQRASKASQKAARASAKAAQRGKADFDKLASSASMIGASFAVMGAGVLAFSQQLADLTNQLTDTSAKSGIAVETLAGLRLAAEGSGMEFGNLESGLIRFQTSVLDASRGSKSMAQTFKTLGVEVKNTDGTLRDADSVFNDAMKSLGEMENTTQRNALAMKLFGREGGAGLIQSGALDNLESMTALAKEFGVAIDQDAIGSMANFQRKMAEFNTVSSGTMQRLMESIAGKNSVSMGINAATKAMVFFGSVAGDTLGFVAQSFENVFGVQQALTLALMGDFAQAKELIADLGDETKETASNFFNAFDRANEELGKFEDLSKQSLQTNNQIGDSLRRQTKAEEENVDAKKEALKLAKQQEQIQKDLERFKEKQAASEQAILDAREQLSEALIKISGSEIDQINLKYDKEIERLQELAEKAEETAGVKQAIQDLEEQRNDEIHQSRMKQLQAEQDKSLEVASQTFGAYSSMLNGIADLVENNAKEEGKAAAKVFALRQGAAIAETAMNTAKGIVNALATYPGPGGIALASIIGAAGATQMAAIASQQPPSFHMGGMASDEMGARVLRGEAVLDRATVRRIGGEEGVKKLQQGNQKSDNVIVIQPFKHFGRFAREIGFQPPRKTGIRK